MKYIVWTGVVLTLFGGQVRGSGKHLICKDVGDVFANPNCEPTSGSTVQSLQGPPGKRGAPGSSGIRGLPGPQGPPGTVDREIMSATAREALQPAIKELKAGADTSNAQLEEMIMNFTETISRKILLYIDSCEVIYDGKCFWMVTHDTDILRYSDGENICAARTHAKVADVYSKEHYHALLANARVKMPTGRSYCQLWLGLTMDVTSKVVSLSSGSPAPYLTYYPGYPLMRHGYTSFRIGVRSNPESPNQGMYNYLPSSPCCGVVCEIPTDLI